MAVKFEHGRFGLETKPEPLYNAKTHLMNFYFLKKSVRKVSWDAEGLHVDLSRHVRYGDVAQRRRSDTSGWSVRTFPGLFPLEACQQSTWSIADGISRVWKSTNKKFVLHFLSATPPNLSSSPFVSLLIQCNSLGKLCKRTVSREQKILDLSNPKCLFVCYVVFFIIKLLFRIPSYHQESASHQGSIM